MISITAKQTAHGNDVAYEAELRFILEKLVVIFSDFFNILAPADV